MSIKVCEYNAWDEQPSSNKTGDPIAHVSCGAFRLLVIQSAAVTQPNANYSNPNSDPNNHTFTTN
jgi:hypothetical protein